MASSDDSSKEIDRLRGPALRLFSTVELVNALEQEKLQGKSGQSAGRLAYSDLVILDELGYLPFSAAGGALLFHLLSKLCESTSVVIRTSRPNPSPTIHRFSSSRRSIALLGAV